MEQLKLRSLHTYDYPASVAVDIGAYKLSTIRPVYMYLLTANVCNDQEHNIDKKLSENNRYMYVCWLLKGTFVPL